MVALDQKSVLCVMALDLPETVCPVTDADLCKRSVFRVAEMDIHLLGVVISAKGRESHWKNVSPAADLVAGENAIVVEVGDLSGVIRVMVLVYSDSFYFVCLSFQLICRI